MYLKSQALKDAILVIDKLQGVHKAIGILMYDGGLRIFEVLKLRLKEFDFERSTIFICHSKGQKDRVTLFPELAKDAIAKLLKK